jgi:hypothetical protein
MQSTDSLKPTDFWWPSPEAFEDLTVEDADEGFTLDAPDDSECGEWLAFWNQSPEHLELFTEEFTKCLQNHANTILEQHGENEVLPDGSQSDPSETQDVSTGSQS